MKLFSSLNSPKRKPKAWRLLPLASPSEVNAGSKTDVVDRTYNPVWVGTQIMPYGMVVNARKSPRDIYDD